MRQCHISFTTAAAFSMMLQMPAMATDVGGATIADACEALDLRACTIQLLSLDALPDGDVGLEVVIEGQVRTLDLHLHSNRSSDYRLIVQGPGGQMTDHTPGPVNTWRGTDLQHPETRAAMSVDGDALTLSVFDHDGRQWFVEPLAGRVRNARPGDHAVYFAGDIISPEATCPVDETWRVGDVDGSPPPRSGDRGGNLWVAEMAVDADYEFYSQYGSVSQVENRVNAVINAVNNQYEDEVDISHELTAIVVRSSNDDPYSTNSIETRLDQLRADWNSGNHPGIARDLVHLFTGANTGSTIGLAYLGAVCSTYEYGVVQSNCCGSFGCATDLSAHEMGHNWGSEHCSCPSWTMHPSLQCANRFTSESEAYIINYRNSHESCLTDTTPQGACCYGTTCLERSETDCEDTGGAFQGDGSDCDSVTCTGSTGACCTQSGSCITVTSAQCDTISGDYQGDNVPCDDEICIPQPEGACCIGTNCAVTEQADCGGTWLGDGTTCDDSPCSATSYAGIRHRIVGVNLVDTPQDTWTVDIYADTGAGERIDAVAGTSSQPKTIASSAGFWQHAFGGGVSTDVNPALFDAFPDLRYDSRVTIGAFDSSGDPFGANELNHIGIDFSTFENGGAISASDGTWFVLPTHEQGGAMGVEAHECESVHGVLLARLTVYGHDSEVTVSALLQGRNELGNPWQVAADHVVSMSEFADCNGNNNNDACDIANGTSSDANGNGTPDECESNCPWDLDGDADTDIDDLLMLIGNWGVPWDVDDLLGLIGDYGCE